MTSQPLDILLSVSRGGKRTLGRQIEDQLRLAIREGTLRPGSRLPSTRDLAGQLGISRPIVVDAYAQLAAEGFLVVRRGARPRVSQCVIARPEPGAARREAAPAIRYDFEPGVPDFSAFPRAAWLRSVREALKRMPHRSLGYGDPQGSEVLRAALSEYLGRVRGVTSNPSQVIVTAGFHQARMLVCRMLAAAGALRIAVEDPCLAGLAATVRESGLELLPIPVDQGGMRVETLERAGADAVVVTPAHQYPTGAVLSGERRAALLQWLRRTGAVALEDDYDAEYRYDRPAVGALHSLDPERIVYAGTASKMLAPALRLGWLIAPPRLVGPLLHQQRLVDFGVPRIDQHALADFLTRGELDRHLRRMRGRYRERRDALVEAVGRELPAAAVCGIAAGLHAVIRLPDGCDEAAVRDQARRRGIALAIMRDYRLAPRQDPPALLLGYAQSSEGAIRAGVRELAAVIRATSAR